MGFPLIFRFRIGKSSRTFAMSNGTVFCIVYRLTVVCQTVLKSWSVLNVTVAVVLFWTASARFLFLAFWYEAMPAAAGQIVAWKVELETAAHLCFNIVDLRVAEQVSTLRVSHDGHAVLVFDYISLR